MFNKEKYLKIYETEGESAAITALHHDMKEIEFNCFESAKGWQPDLYEQLKEYRAFSLELWDYRNK